jgi:CBS domain-containing protein
MNCPDCDHDNIVGADECEDCGASLVVDEVPGNAMERGIVGHTAGLLCPRAAICVAGDTPVREVIAQMVEHSTGCVLVEAEGEVTGVFSDRDVLNDVSRDLSLLDSPVSDHMTANPETITKDDSIAYAMHTMDVGGYRHLPVIDDEGKAAGILSTRDIMRFLCVRYAQTRDAQ